MRNLRPKHTPSGAPRSPLPDEGRRTWDGGPRERAPGDARAVVAGRRVGLVWRSAPDLIATPVVVACLLAMTLVVGAAWTPALAQDAPSTPPSEAPGGVDPGDAEDIPLESDEEFLEQIRVYQQKPFMKTLRFELAPIGGVSLNDSLLTYFSAGAVARFHINEQFSVGASYRKYFHSDRKAVSEIEDSHGVFPERRFRDFYAGGEFTYAPVVGKFAIVDSIVHLDVFLTAGVGMMRSYERGAEGENLFAWNVGVGSHVMVTEWLTLNFEIRDYMYIEPFRGGNSFINDVAVQAGLGFFFPFSYDYRYPK